MEDNDNDIKLYEANKPMTIRGVTYAPGDIVDTSELPTHKIGQFLNQRLLRPHKPQQ